jgi:hypothetical protein
LRHDLGGKGNKMCLVCVFCFYFSRVKKKKEKPAKNQLNSKITSHKEAMEPTNA